MIRAVKLLLLFLQVVEEEVLRPPLPAFSFLWTTSWGKRRSQLNIIIILYLCWSAIEFDDQCNGLLPDRIGFLLSDRISNKGRRRRPAICYADRGIGRRSNQGSTIDGERETAGPRAPQGGTSEIEEALLFQGS